MGPVDDTIASPLLRTDFRASEAAISRARVYATGHGLFQLEINGQRVGDDELAPGWTAYEARLRYTTYDVTDLIRAGDNAMGAWLGDGWWRGFLPAHRSPLPRHRARRTRWCSRPSARWW